MAVICPTVTAENGEEYQKQMQINAEFAKRVHIDLMDGDFAPTKSPNLEQIWWPNTVTADLHLMYAKPMDYLPEIIKLRPNLVIIHAEALVHHMLFAAELHSENIKVGLALLPGTPFTKIEQIVDSFDHVLIFSGNLGYQGGGKADLGLLDMVKQIRDHHPDVEIGWDGGIDDHNAKKISDSVDVLNVGSFIQKSHDPKASYAKLLALAEKI